MNFAHNVFRIVKATVIGEMAHNLISNPNFTGKVHSVFKSAFNILTSTQEIIVVTSKDDKSPWAINVDLEGSFLEMEIRGEMQVTKSDDYLILPKAKIFLPPKDVKIWSHPEQVKALLPNFIDLRNNLNTVIWFSTILKEPKGLGQLLPYVFNDFESVDVERLNITARSALSYIRRLVRSIKQGDFNGIEKVSASLIGLGPGLTPSGDDMLAMLMASMWLSANCFQIDISRIKAINNHISASVNGQTNVLSEKQIEHAAKGKVSEAIYDLIEALLLPGKDLWDKIEKVLKIGGSSGEDLILGIVIGLNLLMYLKSNHNVENFD